jgi:hypothetical protein
MSDSPLVSAWMEAGPNYPASPTYHKKASSNHVTLSNVVSWKFTPLLITCWSNPAAMPPDGVITTMVHSTDFTMALPVAIYYLISNSYENMPSAGGQGWSNNGKNQ